MKCDVSLISASTTVPRIVSDVVYIILLSVLLMHSKHTLSMMAQIEEVTNACELRSSNATSAGPSYQLVSL